MRRTWMAGTVVVMCSVSLRAGAAAPIASQLHPDPVVARLREHTGMNIHPIIQVVGPDDLPAGLWGRVKDLVAYRLHRPAPGGSTRADPAIYLVQTSARYIEAAAALSSGATAKEYIWCLFAAVLAHEAAHTAPKTEPEALRAEAAQLRRCLAAGHLHSAAGWSAGSYLMKVEAKLRNPREHY